MIMGIPTVPRSSASSDINLHSLIELKLALGMTNSEQMKDLADVVDYLLWP